MEKFNLASLPLAIPHIILSKVAENSIRGFGNARVALRGFNEIGRYDQFYRTANLLYMNHWFNRSNAVRTFLLMCYNAGNPEALYLRGMHEFFKLHLVDEGLQKIHLAGESGFQLARYVDGMMSLAFTIDARGVVQTYPAFTREYVDRMSQMPNDWRLGDAWVYDRSEIFRSVFERIYINYGYDCSCFNLEEPVSINGSRSHWKCDRCFWNGAAWDFCDTICLRVREWPIED